MLIGVWSKTERAKLRAAKKRKHVVYRFWSFWCRKLPTGLLFVVGIPTENVLDLVVFYIAGSRREKLQSAVAVRGQLSL